MVMEVPLNNVTGKTQDSGQQKPEFIRVHPEFSGNTSEYVLITTRENIYNYVKYKFSVVSTRLKLYSLPQLMTLTNKTEL